MENTIRMWVRNEDRTNLIGILIAGPIVDGDNRYGVGWSKCNKLDNFNKEKAVRIAESRIQHGSNAALPYGYEDITFRFIERAKKYYKSDNVLLCNQY